MQVESIQKLRGLYCGKLFREWSSRHGVNVKITTDSDSICSDGVASNLDVFLSEDVSKHILSWDVCFPGECAQAQITKARGKHNMNHC